MPDLLDNIFLHFEKRAFDRYNRTIDKDRWLKICEDIRGGKAKFIGYKETDKAELWYYDNMVILYTKGFARTVLPIEDYKNTLKRLSGSSGWRPQGGREYISAASMLRMFYDLTISEADWEDIKKEAVKDTLILKHTDDKKLKRIIYKSREVFLMVDNNGKGVKVVRPSRGLIAAVRYRKKEHPAEILARAIKSHSIA